MPGILCRRASTVSISGITNSFGAVFNDGSGNPPFADTEHPTGGLAAFFVDDKFNPFRWLTLTAGLRPTHFSGNNGFSENAISPRFGAALTIPRLNWTFRGFYGHFYQAPPLVTASGPLLNFCTESDCGFITLQGERDEEFQFGVTIPYRGWVVDADTFRTRVNNFFDHDVIGESNLFFPLTIEHALIRGMGSYTSLPAPRASRSTSSRLFQPDRRPPAAPSPVASPISKKPNPARSTMTSATRSTSAETSLCPGTPMLPPMSTTAPASPTRFPDSPIPATTSRNTPRSI